MLKANETVTQGWGENTGAENLLDLKLTSVLPEIDEGFRKRGFAMFMLLLVTKLGEIKNEVFRGHAH